MKIGDICARNVSWISRGARVLDAARRMRAEHVGDLVIVDDRDGAPAPVGIFTDRDVVVGVLADDGEFLSALQVGDVLRDEPLVTATEDEDLAPVLKRMRSFSVRRVPVVNPQTGALVGILSIDDVVAALSEEIAQVAALVSHQAQREAEGH